MHGIVLCGSTIVVLSHPMRPQRNYLLPCLVLSALNLVCCSQHHVRGYIAAIVRGTTSSALPRSATGLTEASLLVGARKP